VCGCRCGWRTAKTVTGGALRRQPATFVIRHPVRSHPQQPAGYQSLDRRRSRPSADLGRRKSSTRFRLTAAGQVLRPNDSVRRNLPFAVLRGDRPLYLQQRPLNSDGPGQGPNDSSLPRRSALRDPLPNFTACDSKPESGRSVCRPKVLPTRLKPRHRECTSGPAEARDKALDASRTPNV
jgi:hypothetical protein